MVSIFYLVILVLGADGVASVTIPQVSAEQCRVNAERFNKHKNLEIASPYGSVSTTQRAFCVTGAKI